METKWEISKEVLSSRIDDEVILMSRQADAYFGLEPIGSHIWELLTVEPSTLDELVQKLMDEYDIEEEACRRDVAVFLSNMSERELIIKSA